MLFSVIVPCYNSKDFIRKSLDSILLQKFEDYEVVAIDDGSTDGTANILDEYAIKYSKFKVYHYSNAGVSVSRRRGITKARGKYVLFLDSDDTITSGLLANLSLAINKYHSPDIIRYQSNLVNDKPTKDHQRYNIVSDGKIDVGMDALKKWTIPGKKYAVYWLFAFKTNHIAKFSFHETLRCYEDVALIPIVIADAASVVTVDYVGYNYTYNNNSSLTHVNTEEAERQRSKDFYEACKFAKENFAKLKNVSEQDIKFFNSDYDRRLRGKYEGLPENLKTEFKNWFD